LTNKQSGDTTLGYNCFQLNDSLNNNKKSNNASTTKFEVAAIAPELLKIGLIELYKFAKPWKRYVSLCKERNSVLPEGQKMVPATLVSCIDPDLLENLVSLEEIEGRTDADEVVDADLDA
jgi:hypothetical protein